MFSRFSVFEAVENTPVRDRPVYPGLTSSGHMYDNRMPISRNNLIMEWMLSYKTSCQAGWWRGCRMKKIGMDWRSDPTHCGSNFVNSSIRASAMQCCQFNRPAPVMQSRQRRRVETRSSRNFRGIGRGCLKSPDVKHQL